MSSNTKLNKEEQQIHDAFSQIKVDVDSLERKLENMSHRNIRRPVRFSIVAAAILLFIAISGTVYATSGGLEQFLSRFNPNFGTFAIAPLEPAYAIDQDIRIEVVGAQQIGHVVLVYVSMQDMSGENRLTRHNRPDIEIYIHGHIMNGPSSTRSLNFDRSTNTAYFEMIIVGEVGMPRADTLELAANSILCTQHSGQMQRLAEGNWRMTVNTSDAGIEPIVWTDISAGDIHIEYMSLGPFGLQIVGSGQFGWENSIELELYNRRRNIRFDGSGGWRSDEGFGFFSFTNSPIDIDAVSALIIDGERVSIP